MRRLLASSYFQYAGGAASGVDSRPAWLLGMPDVRKRCVAVMCKISRGKQITAVLYSGSLGCIARVIFLCDFIYTSRFPYIHAVIVTQPSALRHDVLLRQPMSYIILDRDGVINFDSTEYIKSPEEWQPIPGSLEAVALLNRAGFRVLVATNQSGIARGLYDLEMLDAIHEKMMRELAAVGGYVEEIFFCPHHPDDLCACRKPKTGMLDAIRKKYNISLPDTFYIGDSLADVGVAEATGCKLILVMTGNGRLTIDNNPYLSIIPQFADLADAAQFVLTQQASIRG